MVSATHVRLIVAFTLLWLSPAQRVFASCRQVEPLLSAIWICDVFSEADLREVNTLRGPDIFDPFPSVLIVLRQNLSIPTLLTLDRAMVSLDTNGFALTGPVAGIAEKLGAGTFAVTTAQAPGLSVLEGTYFISTNVVADPRNAGLPEIMLGNAFCSNPLTCDPTRTPRTARLRLGASVTFGGGLNLGGGGPWYSASAFDTLRVVDQEVDTQAFDMAVSPSRLWSLMIYGSGRLVKLGSGTLTIDGVNEALGGILIREGTVRVSSDAALGSRQVEVCVTNPYDRNCRTVAHVAPLGIDGGTLQAGASFDVARPVVVGEAGGRFDTNGFTVGLASSISGAGGVTKVGAGSLVFAGPATYTGLTRVSAGRLDVAGLAGAVVVEHGALLSGSGRIGGSVDVAGMLVQGAEPLTIDGDLRLAPGATLAIPMSASSASLLQIGGRTTIDGATLALTTAGGPLPRVTTVPLFTSSGAVTGHFAVVAVPPAMDAILGSRQSTTFVVLERTDVPLETLATTRDGRAVAAVVDAVRQTATGDLQQVLREVGALGDADVGEALAQLGGQGLPDALHAGALDAQDALRSVNDRIVDVRGTASERYPAAGASGLPLRRAGVWFKAAAGDRTTGSNAESGGVYGGVAGVDHVFAGGAWLVGVFGGYDRATLDRDRSGHARDRRYRAGGYTAMTRGHLYVAGAVSGAAHRFQLSRELSFASMLESQLGGGTLFGSVDRTAASRFGGREVSGFVESGVARLPGRVAWQPFVGIDTSHLTADTFTESGAGAVNLAVSDATATSLRAATGVRALSQVTVGGRVITPHAEVRYLREMADAASSLRVAFTEAPTRPFELHGELPGRNLVGAAAGLTLFGASRMNLSADYRGVFTAGDQRHIVTLGVAF